MVLKTSLPSFIVSRIPWLRSGSLTNSWPCVKQSDVFFSSCHQVSRHHSELTLNDHAVFNDKKIQTPGRSHSLHYTGSSRRKSRIHRKNTYDALLQDGDHYQM